MLRYAHLSKNCFGGLSIFGIPPKKRLSPAKTSEGPRICVQPRMSCTCLNKEGGNSCHMLPVKQRTASLINSNIISDFALQRTRRPQVVESLELSPNSPQFVQTYGIPCDSDFPNLYLNWQGSPCTEAVHMLCHTGSPSEFDVRGSQMVTTHGIW